MSVASEAERRAATDRQLHETVTARAWVKAFRGGRDLVGRLRGDCFGTSRLRFGLPGAVLLPLGLAGRRITLTVVRIFAGLAAQETPVSSALGIPVLAARTGPGCVVLKHLRR
ncbi:hypothetical protein [Streptomyces cyaneofuscatus]|uniref:hypothetical protein n=1 Tax=Streptomyces cyaneofuscatus TaxID=66883 RepID=UPI0036319CB3